MLRNGMKMSDLPHNFRKAVGCDACGGTGYRGRMVIAETLEISPEIAGVLEKGASAEQLREVAIRQGMTTIAADGVKKAALGKTTLKEVFRVLALK
jgi:general secretion pathway protein E